MMAANIDSDVKVNDSLGIPTGVARIAADLLHSLSWQSRANCGSSQRFRVHRQLVYLSFVLAGASAAALAGCEGKRSVSATRRKSKRSKGQP